MTAIGLVIALGQLTGVGFSVWVLYTNGHPYASLAMALIGPFLVDVHFDLTRRK